ncbi:MAG TPA: hypothetical protein P5205_21120 [Candidatus Paceibacterota bacterium]|nr:hypothetical protein [Verrucomicrobiota bacterium]HSA12865.1 hypothetical protein [Candidatus Paceibacterota bacterium]
MKLVRHSRTRLLFHLGHRETGLLLQILKLYPRVPPAHHQLTKSGRLPDRKENQQLLDEALAEQRAENKKLLLAMLADSRRFARTEAGSRLLLAQAEVEWLLQVLNDIRVGSWVLLGSPEDKIPKMNEITAQNIMAMEMAGHFQSQLLEALHGET